MKSSRCYLCQIGQNKKAFTKFGHQINLCNYCNLFSLQFKQNYHSFIKDYYNHKFFTGSPERAGYADYEGDRSAEFINMTRYLHRLKKFKHTGKLLDVGCATGIFLSHAKRHGFNSYGFDVSQYATNIARSRHPRRIKLGAIDQVSYPKNSFDIITMFDVIEHLKNPRQDLKKLKSFLKPDGILVLNTGDAGSWLAKLQGKDWHFFVPPQHLFFFSRQTLTKLLNQAGFEVLQIDYKGKWISLRYFLNLAKQLHQNPIAQLLYPLVKNNKLGKIPLYFNLFDNIIVYARIA